ncbi:hypothetical protein F0562_018937 [Nyssa sinensis]|uniref:Sulfite exporter TauE/SafE family protein n=1 Tax=Nyssa sinensis TaxID=561372 RepID=A0A5J4ZCJ4_9ASTE|nr:hypothetical protein F0562_018937 [Nyssa sinensis]
MDSGNSGSIQSSSGGDEEYDSRAESISTFLNPTGHIGPMSNQPQQPPPSHLHHSSTTPMFDPLSNFYDPISRPPPLSNPNSLRNLDMVLSKTARSEPNCTEINTETKTKEEGRTMPTSRRSLSPCGASRRHAEFWINRSRNGRSTSLTVVIVVVSIVISVLLIALAACAFLRLRQPKKDLEGIQEKNFCFYLKLSWTINCQKLIAMFSSKRRGGIGGGGLFIPILTIVAGLDLKTVSSFSAFMVTGGSIANVVYSMFITSKKFGGKTLIDYDIALLSEPCMLLGVSIGVICNIVFPEWVITILFAVFLAWSTFKTCKSGVFHWKLESEEVRRNGLMRDEICSGSEGVQSAKVPLLGGEEKCKLSIPWMKLGALVLVWFSFFVLYLLRGNRYGQSVITIEPCGLGYWILSAFQIPLAIIFTSWILYKRESRPDQTFNLQENVDQSRSGSPNKLIFPAMALLAGILGGVFGIGGGMLINPLLLQVGIAPEVTAATCSVMVFFSSTMSAIQYLLLSMEHTDITFIFATICFVASLVGLMVIQRAIGKHGRASLIVFSVGIVMALSTVLMTSYGALNVWRDYTSGKHMGFKQPC